MGRMKLGMTTLPTQYAFALVRNTTDRPKLITYKGIHLKLKPSSAGKGKSHLK